MGESIQVAGPSSSSTGSFATLQTLTGPVLSNVPGEHNQPSPAQNEGFGYNALIAVVPTPGVTGYANTAVGDTALAANTTGLENTGIGTNALAAVTSSSECTAVGADCLTGNNSGVGNNTGVGATCLFGVTSGSDNTAVGFGAGLTATAANKTTTASQQTIVGSQAGQGSATQRNAIVAIGYRALCSAANAIAIGSGAAANGTNSIAIGINSASTGIAIGAGTTAGGSGSVAIGVDNTGTGASTVVTNEIKLGTAAHTVNILGITKNAGGTNTSASSAVTTPTLGAAAQLAQTTLDAMLYIDVTTAGTLTIAIGPTSGVANTIVNGLASAIGDMYSIRLPAGWFIAVTTSNTAVWSTTAITC